MDEFKVGDRVIFRVPGLFPEPGRSRGVVEGEVTERDAAARRLKIRCPLRDEYWVFEWTVKPADGGDGGS